MRVLIADDHGIMRDGLRAILEKVTGVEVVGEAHDGAQAVALTVTLEPDLVLMDVTMPGLNGVDATRQLIHASPRTKVLGLSMNSDRRYVLAMLGAGAAGYLLKNSASDELRVALGAIAAGRKYVSPHVADAVIDTALRETPAAAASTSRDLSRREREVLQLLAEGRTSKQIASRLGVAVSTIESHRRQIMGKLGVRSVAELTKRAIQMGLTSLDY